MKDIVATMPLHIRELYADYMGALDDDGTPDYDARLRKMRHDFANALNAEFLREELKKLDASEA